MQTWKTLSRKLILDQSPWLVVENHEVELPDGRVISDWPWVTTPDYINVVVEMENGEFLCFRQVKYGLPHPTLALVGGYLEKDEAPVAAAQRELREETGCEAAEWISLGRYLVDPNRGMATGNLFLARRARSCGRNHPRRPGGTADCHPIPARAERSPGARRFRNHGLGGCGGISVDKVISQ